MNLPDGSTLMHSGKPYDAAKAHEYYMRTRKLKGRKGASPKLPAPKKGSGVVATTKKKPSPQELAQQRAYAAKRVAEIKGKLAELNAKLKDKIAEAKKAEAEAKKPKTAAEKSKDAREAKQYRDKHKSELRAKGKKAAAKESASDKPKAETVESIRGKITELKGALAAAVERQRSLG